MNKYPTQIEVQWFTEFSFTLSLYLQSENCSTLCNPRQKQPKPSDTICQRHGSKTSKLIKMSKTDPVLCLLSVDIKAHIIESRWPPPAPGRSSHPFIPHTVKLIRSRPHTEPPGPSDPLCAIPSLTTYVFPCWLYRMVYHATLWSCCAHILVLTSG